MDTEFGVRKTTVTILSVLATILVGLSSMFHFESKRDAHTHAEKQYHLLVKIFERDVKITCLLDATQKTAATTKFLTTMEEFLADEPPLPAFIERRYKEWGFDAV